ncbi:FAD-binding oxidoreductase [Paucidesulfovibrio longus]|uniref:FAD-binding oxidoreductase n=1 Tax=Paucidesulfovibrio longus TaxID=889 RepID=UPI0003B77D24|nr:FAD-linked oxidase C-terminal domain-containing protein [Paucidesulfovibrio longus]
MANDLSASGRSFLSGLFPGDGAVFAPEELVAFAGDAGQKEAAPWAAVRPESEEQLCELLKWADAERVPVYARARGTNKVGQTVPIRGGVAVSFLRMNRILDIDPRDFVAVVQPGVVTSEFQAELARQRLFYPPDPASIKISTLGGNVSTCAGGMRALKYGVTRDHLLGMRAVLPGGKVLRLGSRCHKDVAGLDLTRLLAGSAGTLALFSELTLKLLPLPEASASALAGFADFETALAAAAGVFQAGLLPSALEFMDAVTLEALSREFTGPEYAWLGRARAALLFRLDGSAAAVRAETQTLGSALDEYAPVFLETASGPDEEILWDVRRAVSPSLFHLAPDKSGEDVAVPRGRVLEAVRGLAAIGERLGLRTACFGHLGDGNLHSNILYDRAKGQADAARQAKAELFKLVLSLGGTITGEHGVGLSKKDWLADQIGPVELDIMRRLKAAFDPHGIMNPGKEWA